jgi:hypothetical protein
MYNTPKGTYFTNLKKAWNKADDHTRFTFCMIAGFAFVFVLMFSLVGITSQKNEQLMRTVAIQQAEIVELRTKVQAFEEVTQRFNGSRWGTDSDWEQAARASSFCLSC